MTNNTQTLDYKNLNEILKKLITDIEKNAENTNLTLEQKKFALAFCELYNKHGSELFDTALLQATQSLEEILHGHSLHIELGYKIPKQIEGSYKAKYNRDNDDIMVDDNGQEIDIRPAVYAVMASSHLMDAISTSSSIEDSDLVACHASPTNFFSLILSWVTHPQTWGKMFYTLESIETLKENNSTRGYDDRARLLLSLDSDKYPIEELKKLSLYIPTQLMIKEYIQQSNDPLVKEIGLSSAVPYLARAQKFRNEPSFLEIVFGCILKELEKSQVPEKDIAAIRKPLYKAFPLLSNIINGEEAKEEAIAQRLAKKQASQTDEASQPQAPKLEPLEISTEASHLIKLHTIRVNFLAKESGKEEKLAAKDFDVNEARKLVKDDRVISKNSGQDGLIAGEKGSKNFILASFYTNKIEAVKQAFADKAEDLCKKLGNAATDSEKQELELKIKQLDTNVREELSGVIGNTGKANQTIYRLISQSLDLAEDFPNIKPPRELKKPPKQLSHETTLLLKSVGAEFLKYVAENRTLETEKCARDNGSIEGRQNKSKNLLLLANTLYQ